MLKLLPSPGPARSEDGFTLIEVLVAAATSVVVIGAVSTILVISLHQSSRISDRVQATQLGRITLTKLVDELRSTCLKEKFTPVQEESTGSVLWFVDSYGEESEPAHAYEHKVEWTGNSAKPSEPGKLIDYSYTSEGSWPNFTFSKAQTPTRITLGENIYMTETEKAKFAPIFEYSKYATTASASATSPETDLAAMHLGESEKLTTAAAAEVAAVTVSFTASPADKNLALSRAAPLSTEVTFALGAPSSEATITDGPCR
jgi:Tfp pilus assembly protein PilW